MPTHVDDSSKRVAAKLKQLKQDNPGTPANRIGFHRAFDTDKDDESDGQFHAIIGSYLTRLGYSYKAIKCITQAPHNSMWWLTKDNAKACDIDLVALDAIDDTPNKPQPKLRTFCVEGTEDLNLGTGPNTTYDIIEVLRRGACVSIDQCIRNTEGYLWCKIAGQQAWASERFFVLR
jgi:hypothetical protein